MTFILYLEKISRIFIAGSHTSMNNSFANSGNSELLCPRTLIANLQGKFIQKILRLMWILEVNFHFVNWHVKNRVNSSLQFWSTQYIFTTTITNINHFLASQIFLLAFCVNNS